MGRKLITTLIFLVIGFLPSVAQVKSFPYTESFESGLGDWTNATSDDFDWATISGATPSFQTGPSNAYDGNTYLYVEASSPNYPNRSSFIEAIFDFTGLLKPEFSFYYHMFGSNMGTLYLDVYDGVWHINEISISGEQQTGEDELWLKRVVDLSEYGGKPLVKIRLRGETYTSYRGDIAVDLIECKEPCEGIPGIAAVSSGAICTKSVVDLTLSGYGAGVIQWQLSTNNIDFSDLTGGNVSNYTTDSLDLGQVYYFRAEVNNGCSAYSNVVSVNGNGASAIPIPYSEGMESGYGSWLNLTSDNNDWSLGTGGTPSVGTGPSGASEGNSYLFVESSDPNFYSTAILENNFDFSGETAIELNFDYHMYGVGMGELIVLANGNEVWSIAGQQHNADNATWTSATVDLSDFAGQCNVTIQFQGNTSETWTSDIAIDNISIDVPCVINSGLVSANKSILCVSETVDLSLSDQDNGTIQWQESTDGENYTNILGANGTNHVTSLLAVGNTYYYRAEISDVCSSYSNVVKVNVPGNGANSIPYQESFESGLGDWLNSTAENNDWLENSGSTPSNYTGPSVASNGNQYLFIESSSPNYNSVAYLENSFDFSVNTGVALNFDYHMYGDDMGSLSVQANGTTVWSISGSQQNSETDAWSTAIVNLDAYAGDCYVEIRIVGTAGSNYKSDIAIDNISLDNSCLLNAGTASVSAVSLCSTGYVALDLNGYDVGNIQWQRSNDNITFADVPSATVDAFIDGPLAVDNIYFYRAKLTSGCYVYSNLTSINVSSGNGINSAPYTEDWELDFGSWTNSVADNNDWLRATGATPSNETGPNAAQSGSTYLFVEASDPNFNSTSILETSFDLTGQSSAYLSFYYHMYGEAMGNLAVDINGVEVWSISGQQQIASVQDWKLKEINMTAYAGGCNVKVAFRAETGSDFTSDIAIDNIEIKNTGPIDWTGNLSNEWSNVGNWIGGIPSSSDHVRVQNVSSGNYPLITSQTVSVASLSVTPGANVTIGSAGTLLSEGNILNNGTINLSASSASILLKGDWENNGSFSAFSGKVQFDGLSGQVINGASKTVFFDLINNNTSGSGLTIEKPQGVRGKLELKENTKLTNSSVLTLESDALGTGQLAEVPVSAQYIGDMTVERYIKNSVKQWRYLASPVIDGQVMDWQNEFPITGLFEGASKISGSNPNNPSIYFYDESDLGDQLVDGYSDYPQTSNTEVLQNGLGYSCYIRNESPFTLDITGVPRIVSGGSHDFGLTFSNTGNAAIDGWNLIGNPFPCAIDWNATSGWVKSNMDNAIYFTDNENGFNVAYVNGISNPPGASNGVIPSSQAFWVKSNGNLPVLTASEQVKSTFSPGQDFYRVKKSLTENLMYIKLIQGTEGTEESTAIKFDSLATRSFDSNYDALYLGSESSYSVSTLDDENNEYAINSLPDFKDFLGEELVINVTGGVGTYTFNFEGLDSFDATYEIYLVDLFLGTETSVFDAPSYVFNISNDSDSKGDTRFKLRFGKTESTISRTRANQLFIEHVVFPNPVINGLVNVNIGPYLIGSRFEMFDMMGRKVLQDHLSTSENKIIIPQDFKKGVYEYVIKNEANTIFGKLIIQ